MCDDVDTKLAFLVLNEVDVGVDALGLVPPCQLSYRDEFEISALVPIT